MVKGFIVYPTYRMVNGKAYVQLFGRLENGESFQTINLFAPYFWIRTSDVSKAKTAAPSVQFLPSDFQNFAGEAVSKVVLTVPNEVPRLRDMLLSIGIPCYEADIRFAMRFLIDHDLKGTVDITGSHTKGEFVDRVYTEPILAPVPAAEYFPELRVLSIDIETDARASEIYSIACYRSGVERIFLAKAGDFPNTEAAGTEREMLERFCQFLRSDDPDIIIGWNLIDFDFKVIRDRLAQYGIPFCLGRTKDPTTLQIVDSFYQDSSADVPGRVVMDGIHLAKVSFLRLPDYKLNTAAKQILGEEKLLNAHNNTAEIERLYREDTTRFLQYNLRDAELVYKIVDRAQLLALSIRRSMLTRMPLDRINASIASMDSLYLKELQRRKVVAPSAQKNTRDERIRGGYVMTSKPGIYENIIVLDFKSLYPSVIRTFNIDPWRFVSQAEAQKFSPQQLITAPNGAHFRREPGILPLLIQDFWLQRDAAKKRKDALGSNAIKILMNSFFGVLANPTCRFYSLEMGNAITHFGQFMIKTTAERMQEQGMEIIYGDTDSIFIHPGQMEYADAVAKAHELAAYMTAFLTAYVQRHFGCQSFLELEFDKVFKKFLLPTVRGSEEGAKKRYAGIIEENGQDELTFTGLEFVRRDWTEGAKKFQMELFERVFTGADVVSFVKQFVQDLRAGRYDELLVYRKAIRKGVEEYTKTTPPHIQAARKLGRTKTGIMEYVMTTNGPEPLEQRQHAIDYEHYIDKQIKPIADSVLGLFNRNFDDLLAGHRQVTLAQFQ
ncbi:MAG TPA: DNA polymerase II [Candidatus Nanoarchaeia archaeon]|nr:DNA polymerase II [Candidatus Nanoarchaeia archaeon]